MKKQLESVSDTVETKNETGENEILPVASDQSKDAKLTENDNAIKIVSDKKKSNEKNPEKTAGGKRARTGQS